MPVKYNWDNPETVFMLIQLRTQLLATCGGMLAICAAGVLRLPFADFASAWVIGVTLGAMAGQWGTILQLRWETYREDERARHTK